MAAVQLPPLMLRSSPAGANLPVGAMSGRPRRRPAAAPAAAPVAAPARTLSAQETTLMAWIRAGFVRLKFYTEPLPGGYAVNRCDMTFKLKATHSEDDLRDPRAREPNWKEFQDVKNMLRAWPFNFKIDWATKVWTARLPTVLSNTIWASMRSAAADWDANFGPGGAPARRAFAERERQAEAAQRDAERDARRTAYEEQFGIDPAQARRDADAAAATRLREQERELMEKLSRPPVHSVARHVPLKHGAMLKVRDHIMGTVNAMLERIVQTYEAKGLDPTDAAADGLIVTVDAPLEIIEGLIVSLRATTTISAAKNVPASRAREKEAAITWRVLFPKRSEARRVVNRALEEDARYAGATGGGQVQVRSDNTLNVALNALWESLDDVRRDGVANAQPRAPWRRRAPRPGGRAGRARRGGGGGNRRGRGGRRDGGRRGRGGRGGERGERRRGQRGGGGRGQRRRRRRKRLQRRRRQRLQRAQRRHEHEQRFGGGVRTSRRRARLYKCVHYKTKPRCLTQACAAART